MNTQVKNLVEQTVLEKLRSREAFTALDISNTLKTERYPVRHGEVAATVREIYESGAMGHYDYGRRLIGVVTDGGAKQSRAFLYLPDGTPEREYDRRDQSSLPLVSADQARDLTDSVAAGALPVLPRRAPKASAPRTTRGRRDGALAIPRALVLRLGWSAGMTLSLRHQNGEFKITPRPPILGQSEVALRIWGGQRVRVCKTKLRLGALSAEQVTVEVEGTHLRFKVSR